MIRNLSFKQKTSLMLTGGLFCFLVYFAFNFVILKSHSSTLQSMVSQQLPALEVTDSMVNQMGSLRTSVTQAVLSQNFDGLGQMESIHRNILNLFTKWKEQSAASKEEVEGIEKNYLRHYSRLNEIMQNVVAGLESVSKVQNDFQSQVAGLVEVEKHILLMKGKIDEELFHSVEKAEKLGARAKWVGLLLLGFSIAATLIFFVVMFRVNESLGGTNKSLQETSRRLLEMVEETQVSSSQLRSTANRQAASSTETVVSMEQMKRLLSQTSRASSEALELSEASFSESTNGKDLIQNLKDSMTEIERLNTELEDVNQVVKQIREKTNVINDIVFKTQLLSFNANIEAARAGQHGLGFAVVANEMGSLADMSGKAAQQINELLDRSTHTVESTISKTKDKIHNANDLTSRCYEFFKLLTDRSGQLKGMVNSISSAAAEQNTGVEHVVSAMSELNYTASETDKMAQGLSSLADVLKSHSLTLSSAVDSLNFIVRGGLDPDSENKNVEIARLQNNSRDKIYKKSA